MLQETTNDAVDPYVFAYARQAGPQTTDASDDEIDLDSCWGRAVEILDNLRTIRPFILAMIAAGFPALEKPISLCIRSRVPRSRLEGATMRFLNEASGE